VAWRGIILDFAEIDGAARVSSVEKDLAGGRGDGEHRTTKPDSAQVIIQPTKARKEGIRLAGG